jgi:hypothetical protein
VRRGVGIKTESVPRKNNAPVQGAQPRRDNSKSRLQGPHCRPIRSYESPPGGHAVGSSSSGHGDWHLHKPRGSPTQGLTGAHWPPRDMAVSVSPRALPPRTTYIMSGWDFGFSAEQSTLLPCLRARMRPPAQPGAAVVVGVDNASPLFTLRRQVCPCRPQMSRGKQREQDTDPMKPLQCASTDRQFLHFSNIRLALHNISLRDKRGKSAPM